MTRLSSSSGVLLRAVERSDLETWRLWINDSEIAGFLDRVLPVTAPEHEQFFERAIVGNARAVWFAIELADPNRYVGNVWLWNIDQRHRTAEIRIIVGERAAWGTGVGAASIRLITTFAFDALGLEKVYAYVMERNPRAARAFVKAGFELEAQLKNEVYWDGRRETVVRLCALRPLRCPDV